MGSSRVCSALMMAALITACGGESSPTEPVVVTAKPVFTLTGTPLISVSFGPVVNGKSTPTIATSFTLQVQAVGGDVVMENSYAPPALADFGIYVAGVKTALTVTSITDYSIPDGVPVVPLGAKTFTVPEGKTVKLPIIFSFVGQIASGAIISAGSYSVGLDAVHWQSGTTAKTDNSMAGQASWRTKEVVVP